MLMCGKEILKMRKQWERMALGEEIWSGGQLWITPRGGNK